MENVRNHRNIRSVTTNKKIIKLVSEPNYQTRKFLSERFIAIKLKKIEVIMHKSIYLGLSILDLSRTLMYEFWYDYIKPNYDENTKICYMGTDN